MRALVSLLPQLALIFAVLLANPALSVDVGSDGSIPPGANSWGFSLNANTVNVKEGDIVFFQWTSGPHSVVEMKDQSSWASCSFVSAKILVNAASSKSFQFDTSGKGGQTLYFACNVDSHCLDGVKITLNIASSSASTVAPTSPATTCSAIKAKAKCKKPCKWNAKKKKCT